MNLKDRMKSESPSTVPSATLSSTTQEQSQSSREQQLLEQALTKIQDLESTLERTQEEDHKTIQQLSSENSVLMKELQKKSEMIGFVLTPSACAPFPDASIDPKLA